MMDDLTLLTHLARRRAQLQQEWVEEAGAYYLLTQGFTHEDAPGAIPMPLSTNITHGKEVELRRMSLDGTKSQLDELDAEIQRIAGAERQP